MGGGGAISDVLFVSVQQDKANAGGAHWMLKTRKGFVSKYWEDIVAFSWLVFGISLILY